MKTSKTIANVKGWECLGGVFHRVHIISVTAVTLTGCAVLVRTQGSVVGLALDTEALHGQGARSGFWSVH
jgi:hypothetical protein